MYVQIHAGARVAAVHYASEAHASRQAEHENLIKIVIDDLTRCGVVRWEDGFVQAVCEG